MSLNSTYLLFPVYNQPEVNDVFNSSNVPIPNIEPLPPCGCFLIMPKNAQAPRNLHNVRDPNKRYFVIPVKYEERNNYLNIIKQKIDQSQDQHILDLSELKSQIPNLYAPNVGSFVLFLAANYSIQKNNTNLVQTLKFCNNGIRDSNIGMFNQIKDMFTSLQTLDLSGNSINKKVTINGVNVIQENSNSNNNNNQNQNNQNQSEQNQNYTEIPDGPFYREPVYFKPLPPPAPLTINPISSVLGAADHLTLDNFVSCSLDQNSFPTHPFIIEFLDRSWNNLNKIGLMYAEDSQFTYSIGPYLEGSPLSFYADHARNFLKPDSVDNIALGPANIVMLQNELFGTGFYAHPTSIFSTVISEYHVSTMISGGFADKSGHVFRFTRTMVIGFYQDGFKVVNDHIYIQNPSHAKLSGFNEKETEEIMKKFGKKQ
ncbi:hypothetical protein TVAG_069750 [Trichomonas vaginalis G3]|uniref:Uncharacterized protein n=1 Tax=Trichomonas vaginalis (strain ATCC PRA-98 / G3) TaxID=412133 RepID=A2ESL8_TRIV3|nr:nuclear RNA export factor family [Trichomonas vaginalis G3]EAY04327.1 hypothetical protein TVAG_069750 [Trichomonas vaginalis G3]KAI5551901.1 nuclear RNA export factor family [Trichomonas vaginalis G3]|eukprot:XP_001316550.1 hypothetical protein [Trichomonas vaginalis G3]